MSHRFLPTSLDSVSPTLDLDDAISQLARRPKANFRQPDVGAHVFSGPDGRLPEISTDRGALSAKDAETILTKLAPHHVATKVILAGLRSGLLRSYVLRASDHTVWQIPPAYYLLPEQDQLADTSLRTWHPESGEDPSMFGQPIMLSERQFSEWNDARMDEVHDRHATQPKTRTEATEVMRDMPQSDDAANLSNKSAASLEELLSEVSIDAWLAKPFWPWPLALAYSQPSENREAAIRAAVEILELYPRLDSMGGYTGGSAVHRVYEVITGQEGVGRLPEDALRRIEAELLAAIESGRLIGYGRRHPSPMLDEIRVSDWVGGEVHGEATCDLVKAGWREKSDSFEALFGDHKREVWISDLHLPRAGMLEAFGPMPDETEHLAPIKEPWTEERMKAEIAACTITGREAAWRQVFKGKDHGWKNAAFREVWSQARGTKGQQGRPSKPA